MLCNLEIFFTRQALVRQFKNLKVLTDLMTMAKN